jgi:hypothetical protein
MNNKIDIELGLVSSSVTIQNLETGLSRVLPMFTRDLFEAVSQKYTPFRLTKSPFFKTEGSDYGALKHFREGSNGKLYVVCETSKRLGQFNGQYGSSHSDIIQQILGEPIESLYNRGRVNVPIYWPNLLQVHVFKKASASDETYQLQDTWAAWCDNTVLNEDAPVYSFTLPNLYCAPGHNQFGAFSKTCWGSTINMNSVTPQNCTGLGFSFEDSIFNTDLAGSDWYFYALPFMVAGNRLSTSVNSLEGKFLDLETMEKIVIETRKLESRGLSGIRVRKSTLKNDLEEIIARY